MHRFVFFMISLYGRCNEKGARCHSEPRMLIPKLKSKIQMKKITNYKP